MCKNSFFVHKCNYKIERLLFLAFLLPFLAPSLAEAQYTEMGKEEKLEPIVVDGYDCYFRYPCTKAKIDYSIDGQKFQTEDFYKDGSFDTIEEIRKGDAHRIFYLMHYMENKDKIQNMLLGEIGVMSEAMFMWDHQKDSLRTRIFEAKDRDLEKIAKKIENERFNATLNAVAEAYNMRNVESSEFWWSYHQKANEIGRRLNEAEQEIAEEKQNRLKNREALFEEEKKKTIKGNELKIFNYLSQVRDFGDYKLEQIIAGYFEDIELPLWSPTFITTMEALDLIYAAATLEYIERTEQFLEEKNWKFTREDINKIGRRALYILYAKEYSRLLLKCNSYDCNSMAQSTDLLEMLNNIKIYNVQGKTVVSASDLENLGRMIMQIVPTHLYYGPLIRHFPREIEEYNKHIQQ